MKTCSRCKGDLDDESFRIRIDKRSGDLKYLNNTCRECDTDIAKERYQRLKGNQAFKDKNRQRVRQYNQNNKALIKQRNSNRRSTKEYREYVKKYYQKNRDKILLQHRNVCSRLNEDARLKLKDSYIIGQLISKRKMKTATIKSDPDLIELKRIEILSHRLNKAIKKHEK